MLHFRIPLTQITAQHTNHTADSLRISGTAILCGARIITKRRASTALVICNPDELINLIGDDAANEHLHRAGIVTAPTVVDHDQKEKDQADRIRSMWRADHTKTSESRKADMAFAAAFRA